MVEIYTTKRKRPLGMRNYVIRIGKINVKSEKKTHTQDIKKLTTTAIILSKSSFFFNGSLRSL